ncbi:MAG: FkbM family methyltransferase [Bacteroidetes bacterium]|nr:FkbM family methyltransferase [Bacteroidota bacterium]MBI3481940.1 FkbM family methyltransferase [Bacteroidota bacterium]
MGFKQRIKKFPQVYSAILFVLNLINYFDKRFWLKFPKYQITPLWRKRADIVKLSPDNKRIEIIEDAGKIFKDYQLMHNGLKIGLGSYYDYGNTVLLQENRGVHEPQEEFAFQEVLKIIPPGSVMMELGSFWAFYSMWFASQIKNAKCIMIEPDPYKMNFGKLNFKMNNLLGIFELGFITDKTNLSKSIPDYSVDFLLQKYKIDFLHLLHSDIQGYEAKMLEGAGHALSEKKIGFVFISTHGNDLHRECESILRAHGYEILCSAYLNESYAWDGVIVAKAKNYLGDIKIEISKRV